MLSQKVLLKLKNQVREKYFSRMPNDLEETFEKNFEKWTKGFLYKDDSKTESEAFLSHIYNCINLEEINYRMSVDRVQGTQLERKKDKERMEKSKTDVLKIIKES